MAIVKEFMTFLKNYQVIGLAVAFIIGAASTKLVTAFVTDIIMPFVGMLMPGGDWRQITFSLTNDGKNLILVGDFVGALIDFVIIAAVVFMIVKMIMKGDTSKKV